MKRIPFYIAIIGIATIGMFFVGIYNVHALSISPVKQTLILDAGSAGIVPLFVTNNTKQSIVISPSADAFTIHPNTRALQWNQDDEALKWISLPTQKSQLDPDESIQINVPIVIPKNTPPGAYYIGLFAEQFNENGQIGLLAVLVHYYSFMLLGRSMKL